MAATRGGAPARARMQRGDLGEPGGERAGVGHGSAILSRIERRGRHRPRADRVGGQHPRRHPRLRLAAGVPVDHEQRLAPRHRGRPPSCRSTRPTAGSTRSSTRARPAPSAMAASPSASASMASTTPAAGDGHLHPRGGARQPVRVVDRRAGRRPAPPRCSRHFGQPAPVGDGGLDGARGPRPGRGASRASSSISAVSATVTSRRSAGPPPRSSSIASTTSRALPTARPSGWSMSVSSAVTRLPAPRPMPTSAAASRRASGRRLHEGAAPHLDVEHQPVDPLGQLLRHDRGGDERDRLDRGGDVAQRVELAVGRGDAGRSGRSARRPRRAPARRTAPPAGRRGSRGWPPACRACRRCGRGRAPRPWAP